LDIQFIASVGIVAPDAPESRKLYVDALGLPLERADGDYFASEKVGGSKHFGIWRLSQAAQACFGSTQWPADQLAPQISVEFEVPSPEAVSEAATELEDQGFRYCIPPAPNLGVRQSRESSPPRARSWASLMPRGYTNETLRGPAWSPMSRHDAGQDLGSCVVGDDGATRGLSGVGRGVYSRADGEAERPTRAQAERQDGRRCTLGACA